MQVFRLVALAGGAGADVVLDGATKTRRMEVPAEAMQRALDAFVTVVVNGGDQLVKKRRRRRNVEAAVVGHEVVDEGPSARARARRELLLQRHQGRISSVGLA